MTPATWTPSLCTTLDLHAELPEKHCEDSVLSLSLSKNMNIDIESNNRLPIAGWLKFNGAFNTIQVILRL